MSLSKKKILEQFVTDPTLLMENEGKELHPLCQECIKTRVAKTDGPIDDDTDVPLYKKGDFIVPCLGIPDKDKFLPRHDFLLGKLSANGEELENSELERLLSAYDPVTWAKKYLDWEPRVSRDGIRYQEQVLRCTSKRKVLRWGRRTGKTSDLIVWTLFRLFNFSPKKKRWDKYNKEWVNGFSTIMFVAPYLSQVKDFFTRLRDEVYGNEELKMEIKTDVSTPFYRMELKSGMKLLGFSAGSSGAQSLRGQKADFIVLDEMDYLDQESIDAIMPLLMEHNDVEMIASSTPSGRREYFYQFCVDRMDFKEFHFTSMSNPSWSKKMEVELRGQYRTESAWNHEILAAFSDASTSVFQYKYLDIGMKDYRYADMTPKEGRHYVMGVDWNDAHNGTKIRVGEWNPIEQRIRAVAVVTVQKAGWNQTTAVNEMVLLNRIWNCEHIYVDEGHGCVQIELLRKIGQEAQLRKDEFAHLDMNFINTKGINFSSKMDIFDPMSGLPRKVSMKPYMIETAVRFFERGMIDFPMEDEVLLKQLNGYNIAKVNASGMPIFEAGPAGDHDLDAWMLVLLGIEIEFGENTNVSYNPAIAYSGALGGGGSPITSQKEANPLTKGSEQISSIFDKKEEPKLRSEAIPSIKPIGLWFSQPNKDRIYSRDAFNNDDKERPVGNKQNMIQQIRNRRVASRRLF